MTEEETKTEEETSEVNFDEYEDVKPGDKEATKVTEVNKGEAGEFRTDKYWDKVQDKNDASDEEIEKLKKKPAIEVKTENGASIVINLPDDKKIRPGSNLGLWKKTYGEFPKVDQEVNTKVDDNGFNRIVLEK